jgi:hypothetical protein
MMATYPKLLVATECPPNSAGGGATVIRQMLKDWPANRLIWWSCQPDYNKHYGREVAAHRVARIPPKLYPQRRWCSQKSWLLEKVWTPWATRHFRKTLDTVTPDVVWVIPHCWSIPPVAAVLPSASIGFHVSIHDYADVRGNVMRFGPGRTTKLATMTDQLYSSATTCDAICQPMVDDLRARTGRDGIVARAGLEQEDFEYLSAPIGEPTESVRIAYAGTILVEKEFALFVQAVKRIRQRLPKPVWLDFFSVFSYRSREWFDPAWMQEHGNLPAAPLSKALKRSTWGFAPMGLTDEDPRYNRFSLPTKFVSYLAAGLPVITLGHPDSSVVKMASAHQVGLCLTTGNLESLSAGMLTALSDPHPVLKYRAGIQRCAAVEFDARRMRSVLFDSFQKCAAHSRARQL